MFKWLFGRSDGVRLQLNCPANPQGNHPQKVSPVRCPFYGMMRIPPNSIAEQNGNQCALVAGQSPCRMQMNGDKANWDICGFNRPEETVGLFERLETVQVFKGEHPPEKGILFPQHFREVMGRPLASH